MMSFLKNGARRLNQKKSSRICLTHKQCTLLFSILMFICSAVFATCATLGFFHAEETLEILKSDIHIEQEKHKENGVERSSNEALLIKSQTDVRYNTYLLKLLMQDGWILLIASALLIYATATNTPGLMLPWIAVGMFIYITLMIVGTLLYYHYIEGLSFINVDHYVVPTMIASVIYIAMWIVILWYYISLLRAEGCSSQHSAPKSKTVYTQEGLIHTVNQSKVQDQKKYLV